MGAALKVRAAGQSVTAAVVIYESTVYPGATEDECVPLLELHSGLSYNREFFVGYSPERLVPGDKEHGFRSITKVTSERTMLRLGSVIAKGGRIPDEVFERSVTAARALRRTAVKARSERLLPVATAALRDADNGAELADRIGPEGSTGNPSR